MTNQSIFFQNREAFREWLKMNAKENPGIWVLFHKKDGLKANEALEEALCFGWIDGQIKSIDENTYQKKFTPRRKGSNWSSKNKGLVELLEKKGLMTDIGRMAIDEAKKSGEWNKNNKWELTTLEIEQFFSLIKGNEPAYTNLLKKPKSIQTTFAKHYLSAKSPSTKERRLNQIIDKLNQNKNPM